MRKRMMMKKPDVMKKNQHADPCPLISEQLSLNLVKRPATGFDPVPGHHCFKTYAFLARFVKAASLDCPKLAIQSCQDCGLPVTTTLPYHGARA